LVLDWGEPPVIKDEDVEAGELAEQADVAAVGAGQGEVMKEAGGPAVVGAVALATSLVGEGASEKGFPRARRDSHIVRSFRDPSLFTTPGIRSSAKR
jgi:hypothetical protein